MIPCNWRCQSVFSHVSEILSLCQRVFVDATEWTWRSIFDKTITLKEASFRWFHVISKYKSAIKSTKRHGPKGLKLQPFNLCWDWTSFGTGTATDLTVGKILHDLKTWEIFWIVERWFFNPFLIHHDFCIYQMRMWQAQRWYWYCRRKFLEFPPIFWTKKKSVLASTLFRTCLTNWATLTSDYNNFNKPSKS